MKEKEAKLYYGRTVKAWAKIAKVSRQAMYEKIKRGYDPRVLIPRKSTCKNMIGLISTQADINTRGKAKERVQVILDNQAMACIETLQKYTGISDRSKLISALAKAAAGII